MKEIFLPLPGREESYRLLLGPGLRQRLSQLLDPLDLPRRLFLVADARVARLHGQAVTGALAQGGYLPEVLSVSPGERSKSWRVVERLARQLLALGAERRSPLIALGGGVVGDLTGFLASIYMRGVPFIQVPTTLLAMVDAAIGGKTGINLPEGKNLLGTFHQPRLVVIDPEFLGTLPRKERLNGLAEIVKAGFIRDPDLLSRLKAARGRLFADQAELLEVIHRAAAIKAEVVAADVHEADLRRILNFGHTLGHALEQAAGFRLPHGQAVAWGMLAALRLSEELVGLPPAAGERGRRLIKDLGLARSLPRLDPQAVLAALPRDKKRQDRDLVFVLLKAWGEPVLHSGVPLELVEEILREVI
ncbi:MAG: 3-dehydroquinate synthase [Thermodesulfobacteriota bacterium]